MHAAMALLSLLEHAGNASSLWRGDETPVSARTAANDGQLSSGFKELDRELPEGGWPAGQLIELLVDQPGIGELSLLAPALKQMAQQHLPVVWVLACDGVRQAEEGLPYAPALAAAGIHLAQTIFVKPATPRESLWAVEQALRAEHLGAVIAWLPAAGSSDSDFKALRRLHLLAQRHAATVFILRESQHAQAPSPAVLRLQLAADGNELHVNLLKRRGRPLLDPIALSLRPAHWNHRVDVLAKASPREESIRVLQMIAASSARAAASAEDAALAKAALVAQRWSPEALLNH